MDRETIALVATFASLAVGLVGLLAAWLWRRKPRVSREARAETGGVAISRTERGTVIVAQPGATVNYYDGLPQATGPVRDPFDKGTRLQEAHQHEAAIAEFEKAFAAAESDSQRCALHILIGNSLLHSSRLAEAEGHYREALDAARRAKDRDGEAAALGNLGIVYHQRDDLDKAEEHFRKTLAIYEEIGNKLGQATALLNLAYVYDYGRQRWNTAGGYYKQSLEAAKTANDDLGQAAALNGLAHVHAHKGQRQRSLQLAREALAIYRRLGDRDGVRRMEANIRISGRDESPHPRRRAPSKPKPKRARKKPPPKKP